MAAKDDRYNDSAKGHARIVRYRATGAHAVNQRRYYENGGRHQQSAYRAQARIDRYQEELNGLS